VVVEQIIRPTGLLDPTVEIRPVKGQVDDLLNEIRKRAAANQRVLVTTLTKRMSEDLAEYLLRGRCALPVSPFGGHHSGPHQDPARTCGAASSTC